MARELAPCTADQTITSPPLRALFIAPFAPFAPNTTPKS